MMKEKSKVLQSPGKMMELKREHSEEPECMGGNELCKYLSLLFAIFNMVH